MTLNGRLSIGQASREETYPCFLHRSPHSILQKLGLFLEKWVEGSQCVREHVPGDIHWNKIDRFCLPLESIERIVREMEIKTTMRYHFTPIWMAIINKSTNSKC